MVLLLACGDGVADRLLRYDPVRESLPVRAVPRVPGAADIDPLLADVRTVLVAGSDADLAAVVLRLLRTERLSDVDVGYLPASRRSPVARLWRLPADPLRAEAVPVPLVRDDNGGVLLGRGEITPVDAVAYCDDVKVLHGTAAGASVTPDPAGVAVRVGRGSGRVTRAARGRAVQFGCAPSRPVRDGEVFPREVERWTWYRHTEDLRLLGARPRPVRN